MVELGLLEEIKTLLDRGIPEKSTAMQAIGYKEFLQVFHGNDTAENAISQVQQASRKYAKRQLTWFRRNSAMNWLLRTPQMGTQEILLQARRILLKNDN
jgi:tRNA dimethylallyltransferase